ncbi:hypothetical protein CNR22_08790 [Sphingobacteriaceae bacterium]|nr:hypothetical protein CNR22_08790 [Sphingobacteriaceae bacterium]
MNLRLKPISMKHFYSLFFLFAFFSNHSQNFTNGSVYNYNVGDTIVTSYQQFMASPNPQPPPSWTYRIFTGKNFSTNMDTVYYTVHDVVANYTCYPCGPVINSYNSAFAVTDLSASALNFQFTSGSCGQRVDTSYINNCGIFEHDAFLDFATSDSNCFEPPTLFYRVIEGIGVFEHTLSLTAAYPNPSGFETRLEWYRKGSNRCGQSYGIPDGLSEFNLSAQKLKVFPNPSNGLYLINTNEEGTLIVMNSFGQELSTETISPERNQINLTNFAVGVYTLKFKTAKHNYLAKVVKE